MDLKESAQPEATSKRDRRTTPSSTMSVPAGQNRSITFTFFSIASSSPVGDRESGGSRRNCRSFSEADRIRGLAGPDGGHTVRF
jgi:hypothetical protein